MVLTQEAPLANQELTREDILKRIPQYSIDSIFLRPHLDRELVIGTIGDRGGGKSATDAVIAIVCGMLAGKSVWSNMKIKCGIDIDDAAAKECGLNYGGTAHYESLPLEKSALLKLDESYRGGWLVIEEINVQYSNVRRFMSNTNVDFNEVCQQLRKFKTSLVYNVIDEMFIDPQLRALTDIFISTYDTAFDLDALAAHKPSGCDFKWKVFPMSGYLAGEQGKYSVTKKSLPPVYFHFKRWQGIYDSFKHQEKGVYTQSTRDRNKALAIGVTAESSGDIKDAMGEYGWLSEKAIQLKESKLKYIEGWELSQFIGSHLTREIKEWLKTFGIRFDRFKQSYKIEKYSLEGVRVTAAQP